MIVDDGFAGAGGWDLALRALGHEGWGIENMKEARATRAAAGLVTQHDDIWTFEPSAESRGRVDSPPCQSFSQAGSGTGVRALSQVIGAIQAGDYRSMGRLRRLAANVGDERTALVLTPLHFATAYNYEWVCWEQVPTVLPVWQACAQVLRADGYSVWTGYLAAEMYGVPQTRKRAVLIASRAREVSQPSPTHSRYYPRTPERLDVGVAKWVSMAEALGCDDGFEMRSNYGSGGDPAARGIRTSDQPAPTVTSKIDRNVVEFVQSARYNATRRPVEHPAPTITGGHDSGDRVWRGDIPDWCHRRPSTTIDGTFKPEIVAAPGYRTTVSRQNAPGSVRVTVQEAGVLQSFPADYPWQGAKGKQFLQCGNAIPPLLAQAILGQVI